jgi:Calpain family cysteine protease
MAAMAAAVIYNPDAIRSLFTALPNGSYNVRFREPKILGFGGDNIINVDTDLPCQDPANNQPLLQYGKSSDMNSTGIELWVPLLEKAYAVAYGGNSYAGIENGMAGWAYYRLTGEHSRLMLLGSSSEDVLLRYLKGAVESRAAAILGTQGDIVNVSGELIGNHAYVVIGVDSAKREVTLYNPHGKIEVHHISKIKKYCPFLYSVNREPSW